MLEYAKALSSLNIPCPIARMVPVSSENIKEGTRNQSTFSKGESSFTLGPVTLTAKSKDEIIQFASAQNLDALSTEHIIVTLKMLQQFGPKLGDIGTAMAEMSKGIGREETRRAKILLQLAGAGPLRDAVMEFAALDRQPQRGGSEGGSESQTA
jgi:hypothetical protein